MKLFIIYLIIGMIFTAAIARSTFESVDNEHYNKIPWWFWIISILAWPADVVVFLMVAHNTDLQDLDPVKESRKLEETIDNLFNNNEENERTEN